MLSFRQQRIGADQAIASDSCAIQQYRTHPDQGKIAHAGGMNNRPVADGDMVADAHRLAGIGMQDATVLDVGTCPHRDPVIVAPQHRAPPHAGMFFQAHFADQDGIGRDPVFALGRQFGADPVKRIERHSQNLLGGR